MASLKEDTSLVAYYLKKDRQLLTTMGIATQGDLARQIVPMRQQPNEASDKPLITVYIKYQSGLGGRVTSNQLIIEVWVPLTTQRESGLSFDITRRVKEVLDHKPIGRGLIWMSTDPDLRSMTGWHKARVTFTFNSTQY